MTNFLPGGSPQQQADQLNLFLSTLFGGKSPRIRYGSAGGTFGGGTTFVTPTVSHGLGTTPIVVLATGNRGGAKDWLVMTGNFTATQFTVTVVTRDASIPGAGSVATFYWIAVA